MMRIALSIVLLLAASLPAMAQVARVDPLVRGLALGDIVAIMHEEGVDYGRDLDADLFDGRGGDRWAAMVTTIYDSGWMERTLSQALAEQLAGIDIDEMVAFFTSDRGSRIIRLEVSARRALLDESVEQASRAGLDDMILNRDPRLDLIRRFSDANALVENNVVGAMNANYAFFSGLAEGGDFAGALTDEEILADVWGQEQMIRDDTEEWLFSYLALAYRPLSDEDLEAYIAFSESAPGKTLNNALFEAFDVMFVAISLALGRAAAQFLAGEEL